MKAIDLFCGAGGLSLGFEDAGYEILLGNDSDQHAGATFSALHPRAKFLLSQIENLDAHALLSAANLGPGQLDCLIGGPPCQGFSTAGGRDGSDPRNRLIFEYLAIVRDILPRWFLFENVEGILTSNGGESIASLVRKFLQLGYWVRIEKLNFASYGLPQARKRVIIVGNRLGLSFALPKQTHSFDAGKHKSGAGFPTAPTLMEALSGLGSASKDSQSRVAYASKDAMNAYDAKMREANNEGTVSLHFWSASNKDFPIFEKLRPGQTMRDLPEEHWHESYRRRAFRRVMDGTPSEKRGGPPAGVKRLQGDLNSLTITSASTREFIHPIEHRPLTLREAARLQSFGDVCEFVGPQASIAKQIGNAFPPMAARVIAGHLAELDGKFGTGVRKAIISPTPCLLGYRLTDSEGRSPALARTESLLNQLQNYQPSLKLAFG
jgi:DNA (cytosine-5)-methyltransferase 1